MADPTPEALPRPTPHTLGQRVADGYVLINLETDRVLELNDTGARVWELLAECDDLPSLLGRLRREFSVDEPLCEEDVRRLMQSLSREGLISDTRP